MDNNTVICKILKYWYNWNVFLWCLLIGCKNAYIKNAGEVKFMQKLSCRYK